MAALYPLTLDAWNSLLGRINNLASSPPEGCDPVNELPLVTAPHKWSAADITAAQDKLREICSDNDFTTAFPGGKWRKLYIDELDAAIDNGWCNCQQQLPCCVPQGMATIREYGSDYDVTVPYWQVLESYLYGNISYSTLASAIGADVLATLEQCVGDPANQLIHYYYYHREWSEYFMEAFWANGSKRSDLEGYWCSNGSQADQLVDDGWVTSLAPAYAGGVSYGEEVPQDPAYCFGCWGLGGWILDPGSGNFYHWCATNYRHADYYYYDFYIKTCY